MKFKNIIISIIIVFSTVEFSFAQNESTTSKTTSVEADNYVPQSIFRAVKLGIYGSLGVSWMKPKLKGYESQGIKAAYSYGLLIDYNFTENYTFSSGISYNSFAGKLSYTDVANVTGSTSTVGILNRSYRINYIGIPTLLKLKTNQMGYFTYFTQLGLRHNIKLNSSADDNFEYDNNPVKTLTTLDQDMKKETSFYRLSFSFAIGTEYAISQSLSAYANIGYDNGLTNSLSGKNSITNENESAFIKRISLTAGFLF